MIEAVMLWNEPNNLSHWDFEVDRDWSTYARMVKLAAAAVDAENPKVTKVLGGISPIDPAFILRMRDMGVLDELDVDRHSRLSSGLESLDHSRVAGQTRGDSSCYPETGLGFGSRRVFVRRRRGAGVRTSEDC